jgi:hypothetical protein
MPGNITIKYGTSGNYTCTLASLATDTNLLVGRQTTVVSNTTTLADDYLVSGKIKCGTTPTVAKQIEVWVFGDIDTAGTYQDAFAGTDAGRTISFANLKPLEMRNVATWVLDSGATTGSVMYFNNISLKGLFGYVPGNHGLWVVHNTVAALDATGGSHVLSYTPVFNQYT